MLRLLSIIQHFSILYNVIGRHRSSGILTQQHDCIDFILDENVGALAENIGVLFDPRTSNYFAIAPSAKKLWGVEEGKEDSHKTGGGGILNLNDQMWRDSTWSTSDHGVTQGMAMVPSARRPGATFPGTDNGAGVLSPRSSDSSGLGVKMVEYVLGTSPTSKDNGLEPRMRGLVLNSDGSDVKKEKDKAPASPYDVKKELVDASGAIQTNGMVPVVQNGIDNEDKYNRTPGSRQPSPTDDGSELAAVQAAVHHSHQASAAAHQAAQVQAHNQAQAQLHKAQQQQQQQQHGQQMHDVVIVQNHVGGAHSMLNHHGIPHLHQALPAPPPHPTHMSHIGDSVTQHFDHMMNMEAAGAGFESQYSGQGAPQQQPQQNTGAHAQPGMDSPNVLQPAFDVQVSIIPLVELVHRHGLLTQRTPASV
ncbi:hypothetical protein M8J75_008723 [Diaphorina citri]|nr:hypothetical protein M8J75_008723 [Diaphorina citri]